MNSLEDWRSASKTFRKYVISMMTLSLLSAAWAGVACYAVGDFLPANAVFWGLAGIAVGGGRMSRYTLPQDNNASLRMLTYLSVDTLVVALAARAVVGQFYPHEADQNPVMLVVMASFIITYFVTGVVNLFMLPQQTPREL